LQSPLGAKFASKAKLGKFNVLISVYQAGEFCPEYPKHPKTIKTNNRVPVRPDSDGLDVEEVPVVVAEPVAVRDIEHLQLPAYHVRRRTLGDERATLRTG
jgi:hypothetical protein